MCSTVLTKTDSGDLNITCTMNCLEVGTVGGGTILLPQQACLNVFLFLENKYFFLNLDVKVLWSK